MKSDSLSLSAAAEKLLRLVDELAQTQTDAVREWHAVCPDEGPAEVPAVVPGDLLSHVLAQHYFNYRLWHVEEIARRTDVNDSVIADCKRRIDRLNQCRNDAMERVDSCFMQLLEPLLPVESSNRVNTEPPGMAVDRLSILSLKIWHMAEQVARTDAGEAHVASCRDKLAVLERQREVLLQALKELIVDYLCGEKRPNMYYQCKMYNDPSLNPQLYGAQRS